MPGKMYTVEELLLDDSFLSYCLDKKAPDKVFWEKEIELHSFQKGVFAEARYTIIMLHGKLDDNEVARQVEKIKKLISQQGTKQPSLEKNPHLVSLQPGITKQAKSQQNPKRFRRIYAIYGVPALMLIFLGAYLFQYTPSKVNGQPPQPIELSYKTGLGERKTVQLPDGSVAVLNSNSSITHAADFNKDNRAIMLNGEAFFQVVKNPAKPFIVHTGNFSAMAIGTAFYVYGGKGGNYKVDLLEGKVQLASNETKTTGSGAAKTMLLQGEEGTWQPSKMSFTKTLCDSIFLKTWIGGKLSFENLPVEKVLVLLQEWYGVDIIVKHKRWGKLSLTGEYDNKPLDHVLKIICFSLSAGYSYSGNQVIIE